MHLHDLRLQVIRVHKRFLRFLRSSPKKISGKTYRVFCELTRRNVGDSFKLSLEKLVV